MPKASAHLHAVQCAASVPQQRSKVVMFLTALLVIAFTTDAAARSSRRRRHRRARPAPSAMSRTPTPVSTPTPTPASTPALPAEPQPACALLSPADIPQSPERNLQVALLIGGALPTKMHVPVYSLKLRLDGTTTVATLADTFAFEAGLSFGATFGQRSAAQASGAPQRSVGYILEQRAATYALGPLLRAVMGATSTLDLFVNAGASGVFTAWNGKTTVTSITAGAPDEEPPPLKDPSGFGLVAQVGGGLEYDATGAWSVLMEVDASRQVLGKSLGSTVTGLVGIRY